MTYSTEDVQVLRTALETEARDLETSLAEHGKKETGSDEWDADSSGLEGEEADSSDTADQIEELITNVPLVAEFSSRLRDIKSALEKMDAGTYGVCEVGQEPISLDRLTADPAARTCITHSTE